MIIIIELCLFGIGATIYFSARIRSVKEFGILLTGMSIGIGFCLLLIQIGVK